MAKEYDFEEMAECWSGIRSAFEAYRSSATESRRQHYHTNLIRQLDHFFRNYPNPFGPDEEYRNLDLHEAVASAHDRSDVKGRAIKAQALLADIDKTIDHKRKTGARKNELDRLRSQREQALQKIENLTKKLRRI